MTDKGAHFYRCDLQVHTPRDRNWTGSGRTIDVYRNAYARLLVQACRDRGLQGVAATDHHDMAFAEHVRRAAREETYPQGKPLHQEQRLIVFPGMELTLSVPCQASIMTLVFVYRVWLEQRPDSERLCGVFLSGLATLRA